MDSIFSFRIASYKCTIGDCGEFAVISIKDSLGMLFLELHGRFVSFTEAEKAIANIKKMRFILINVYEQDILTKYYNTVLYDCYMTRCENVNLVTGQVEYRINVTCTIIDNGIIT